MPTLTLYNKAPGRTAAIQRYTKGTETAVGSPVPGVNTGYSYAFDWPFPGDWDCVLLGFVDPAPSPFPVREAVSYDGLPWSVIDAFVYAVPVIPVPIAGLCNVLVSASFNGAAIAHATVQCHLEDKNNTVDGFLMSKAVESGCTDSAGNCILTLVQFGEFTRGGVYRLRVYDPDGKLIHDRRVKITNASTANAEDLEDAA